MAQRQLMMDSGAFTVWNIGGEVDLEAYIQFCKEYEDVIDAIVALDVIPDSPAPSVVEDACQRGWDNYQRMIDAGLPKDKVLPVFHQFDGFHWLEKYMEAGVPYIGLSHRKKGVSREQQMMWLDSCMNLVCDSDGNPLIKTHGFGLTSVPMIVRYPWHTVDSSTALKEAMYGGISVPWKRDGKWQILRTPRHISVSNKSGDKHFKNAHYHTLPPLAQKMIRDWLDEAGVPVGVSKNRKEDKGYKHITGKENILEKNEDHLVIEEIVEPGVTNTVQGRTSVNMYFYERVEREFAGVLRKYEAVANERRLLPVNESCEVANRPTIDNLNIYIAGCTGTPGTGADLSTAKNRILSYHYIGNSQKEEFNEFVKQIRNKKNGSKKSNGAKKAGKRQRRNDK